MTLAEGTRVLVHYTGTLDDGTQFDSSRGREPLEVILGQNMVIPGFEQAIVGMDVGQTVTVTIAEEHAYGPHNEEMVIRVPKTSFPPKSRSRSESSSSCVLQKGTKFPPSSWT